MFRQLLVAIDDSGASSTAVSFAVALAQRSGCGVHVLHVNEYIVSSRGVPLQTDEEATQLVVDAIEELRSVGIRASGSVRRGPHRDVARTIATSAAENTADAIVIGSNRRRRLGLPMRARVHDRIMALSPLPILTAPPPLAIPADVRLLGKDLPAGIPAPRSRTGM
jgi:nucleotide-binding universal stress UspA family protein